MDGLVGDGLNEVDFWPRGTPDWNAAHHMRWLMEAAEGWRDFVMDGVPAVVDAEVGHVDLNGAQLRRWES